MSVHMFRVFVSDVGTMDIKTLQDAIDDWVSGHTKWTESADYAGVVRVVHGTPDDPSTAYWWLSIRFERDDTKDNILQKLGDKLENKVAWYRVGYHECTHDEPNPVPCSWDDNQQWADKNVTIPNYVPGFGVK